MEELKNEIARKLAFRAALLFLFSALGGVYLSLAMTELKGTIDQGAAVAAHLNAILGAFWIICVAWSLKYVTLSEGKLKTLAFTVTLANYANWIITSVKAALKMEIEVDGKMVQEAALGVEFGHGAANSSVHVCLILFVVIPTFTASVLWVMGLRSSAAKT